MTSSHPDQAEAGYDGRVLLVTKGLDLGGLERVVVDLAIGLLARNVSVEVAVVNPRRCAFVPMLDAAGVLVDVLDGHDIVGSARRVPLTHDHQRSPISRGPRARPVPCICRPLRRPAGSDSYDGSYAVDIAAYAHSSRMEVNGAT